MLKQYLNHFSISVKGIVAKILWLLLIVMILTHVFIFVIYSQHDKDSEVEVNRYIVRQQVLQLIQTVQFATPDAQKKIVSAIDMPNVKISLDHEPEWRYRVTENNPWEILQAFQKENGKKITLSFLVRPHYWLNVAATIMPTSWMPQVLLLGLEILVAIFVILFIVSIKRFSGPLYEFKAATERLGIDPNSPPLKEYKYSPSVVKETAHAMNVMRDRIQELLRHRMQMLAALSHDLRTPITRMRLRTQFVENEEQRHKFDNDLNDIEGMVNETLAYARGNNENEKKEKIDLNALLEAICYDYSDMDENVEFIGPDERILFYGSPIALKRAYTNLINNGIKYAGSVKVKLSVTKNVITVLIMDEGPGIPEHEKDKVLDPFYRGEKSRSRSTGGVGLGLAVAREVVLAHNGKIELLSPESGGLIVKTQYKVGSK